MEGLFWLRLQERTSPPIFYRMQTLHATTKMSAEAMAAMVKGWEVYGNPSSLHTIGQEAAVVLQKAREQIAVCLDADPKEIYFTSGGSEADNQALRSAAAIGKRNGHMHIISTAFEHHAILHTLEQLKAEGFSITLLDVHENGMITPEQVEAAIQPDTCLVTVMYANNEIGSILPISVKNDNIDMLSLSAHKFHGPKGIGVLYAKKGVRLTSLIAGGAQERGKRAGTENIPAILGMAAALQDACDHMEENTRHCLELRERLIAGLSKIPHSVLNGDREHRLPSNVHFCFEGIEGESLLLLLDQKGICASSGSACTSGSLDPSHVLLAIGRPHEIAHGSLRLSLGEENTMAEVDYMLQAIPEVVAYLRHMSPVWRDLESGKKSFLL